MSKSIDPKDIEVFLLDNPDFFVSREALLSELDFKHDSGNASSLLERQIKRLREEQNTLMDLLTSFVGEAKVNEDLFIKSKNLTLSILEANDDDEVTERVVNEFTKNFGVDKCLLRFFNNKALKFFANSSFIFLWEPFKLSGMWLKFSSKLLKT